MLLGVKQKFASFSCYNRNVSQVERYQWRLLYLYCTNIKRTINQLLRIIAQRVFGII